jgi:hypothetical protein
MSAKEKNPYTKEEPELRSARNDGFAAGRRNESIPQDRIYDKDNKEKAWVEGYTKGQMTL